MKLNLKRCFLYIFATLILLEGQAIAQTSQLTGAVLDEQALPVARAAITLNDERTGFHRDTLSDSQGRYAFFGLAPGTFSLVVTKDGFAASNHTVTLTADQRYNLNLELAVTGVAETVSVQTDRLRVAGGTVSTVIGSDLIEKLPLNGRNFLSLLELSPGTVLVPVAGTSNGQFVVNGQRSSSNYVTVDGVSANTFVAAFPNLGQSAAGSIPVVSATGSMNAAATLDSLEEVRIQTSTFSAEFGRAPGGQVSVVTKSGSNNLKGSGSYVFRDEALDATDSFTKFNGLPKPALRQDTLAGVLGGPIRRNSAFFFVSTEYNKLTLPKAGVEAVPSVAFRAKLPPVLQGAADPYPLPNGDILNSATAQYRYSYSDHTKASSFAGRFDQNLGTTSRVFARVSYAPSTSDKRNAFFPTTTEVGNKTVTAGMNFTPSSNAFAELRLNVTHSQADNTWLTFTEDGAAPLSAASLPAPFTTENANYSIGFANMNSVSVGPQADNRQRQFNLVGTYTLARAGHSMKAGVDYRLLRPEYRQVPYEQGIRFFTEADALAGIASDFFVNTNIPADLTFHNASFFAQDDWQLTTRTTLSYGLRFEVNPSPSVDADIQQLSVNSVANPAATALDGPTDSFYRGNGIGLAPRVGIVHSLRSDGALVVRGGVGLFYDTGQQAVGSVVTTLYPFAAVRRLANVKLPIPAQLLEPPVSTPENARTTFVTVMDPDLNLPRSTQWNATLDWTTRRLGTISAGYVAARNRRLLRQTQYQNPNALLPRLRIVTSDGQGDYDSLQLQWRARPVAGATIVTSYALSESTDDSSWEGFNLASSPAVPSDFFEGPSDYDVRHTFSLAGTYDLPSPSKAPWLLGGWSVDALMRGRTGLPLTVVTGTDPVGLGFTGVVRPDLVPGQSIYIDDPAVPSGRRLNRAAFQAPAAGTVGNLKRNSIRGFSAWQLDMALARRVPAPGRSNVELRIEAFNLLNTPMFEDPQRSMTNANFGRSTRILAQALSGTSVSGFSSLYQFGGPRSVQLTARVRF